MGTFGLTKQVDAVGATPPVIAYDPDTYENITPARDNGSIKGGKIEQLTGTNELPKLTVTYKNDGSNDPWKGGTIDFHWESHIKLTSNLLNPIDLADMMGQGFVFVAIINLPKQVTSAEVLRAVDWDTASLHVNEAKIKLSKGALMSAGNHTLRFGLGAWDNTESNMLSTLIGIITKPGFVQDNIPLKFDITIDVAKMTANGDRFDTSPGKILTTGKLQPAISKKVDFSVDFYDSNNVVQDSHQIWPVWYAGGRFYPKLTNGKLNPAAYAKTSSTTINSWNSYISPWDTTSKYNSINDSTEYVDGNNKNLPGTTNNRTLTMNLSEGSFTQLPVNRFDRVVNYFTGKNETAGSTLTHTPIKTSGLNQQTPIVYSGNDSGGTALSPVTMNVLEKYVVDGTITPTKLNNSDSQWGKPLPSKSYPVEAAWKANALTTGSIHYRLYKKATQQLVGTYEDRLFQSITANNGSTNTAVTTLPVLPSGQYYFDIKLVDDVLSKAYPELAYKWQSEQTGVTSLKEITVANFPNISQTSNLKNLSRTPETGEPLTALAGDSIQETSTFTLDKIGDSLADMKVNVALPGNVTYEKGSLTLNGTVIPDESLQTGISIPAQFLAKVGDKLTVTYKYKINVIDTSVNDVQLPTKPDMLSGNIVLTDNTKLPIAKVSTTAHLINIPKQELSLIDVPDDFTFGNNLPVPTQAMSYKAKGDFSFDVKDTRLPSTDAAWQLTGRLSTTFKTTAGKELNGASVYFNHGGEKLPITETNALIYQNDGTKKGDIPVDFPDSDGLLLEVNSSTYTQADQTYQGVITWELSTGPVK
ncbi:WxL domain-containing protein [Enterococcus dongliensis]|uniref:WxL domain-containing protein n=2 Tax=Enterococcus dongliensis TaxID=2559925 RepID=A0AAW8TDJ4_9ENTE|nr:WxL domain-containing protein [Enterococcus dongliensis]MDT2595669.1 WxL domain-containing protein [Enterococcus dongliensis]MDT2602629.1 WxL domain-containing protein [Enterococcus dongliensis]MDT2633883.1 WxL domain-containing protein [Enterococcus dongliensis]MDT2636281.1 WxL domain-containing protein [Enterococcus dongliensis]MDT2641503.1 WxL domain-containing protein [Enterococcus dongliensis]